MVDVASFWFFEKNDYNYVGNTCVANRLCDDYKQVTFRLRGGFIVVTLSNLTTQQNVNWSPETTTRAQSMEHMHWARHSRMLII